MTYSSSGPSLAQAPVVDPPLSSSSFDSSSSSSSSPTSSHSHSHARSNSPSHARSIGKRHVHIHRYDETEAEDQDNAKRNIESNSRLRYSHQRRAQTSEAKSPPKLDIRDETTGYVTQVVQTVSLVQVVDSTGSPIAVQTLYGTPNTIVVDSASGSTISVSNPESSTTAVPASNPASTDDVVQSSTDMTYIQTSTPGVSATSADADLLYATPSATSSYTVELDSQGSAVTPGHNGTSLATGTPVSSQTTLTNSLFSTPTGSSSTGTETSTDGSMYLEMISSSSTRSSTSSSFTSSSTTLSSTTESSSFSSTIYSYSTETWTSTQYGDDQGGDGGNYGIATASGSSANPTSTSSSDSSSGTLTTTQKQVIGGVVGSIAGVAIVALLLLLAIKYKKRQGGHALLGEGPAGSHTQVKGLITDGSGGPAMTQRSGPFAVAAALAGLSAKRRSQPPPVNTSTERGFYRVSGKKLPSVIQNGGDGYTSPQEPMPTMSNNNTNRDSVASGHTDYWRGSMAFDPSEGGGSARLALGSPMRPVSGVPVIRTGPARTPVTEENPFADPVPRPRPDSDALGDSIGGGSVYSQDGSWSSPSRFQERI